ncbi:MAG: cation diffusion facilitator family transporter [Gemmatimonadota bacterium]
MIVAASREQRARDVRRVLVATLIANASVVIAKTIAGASAHSLSVLADAAHSSVDAANNILALWVARVAAKAPDAEHPYGHGKFETVGALAIVAFLSITVFQLLEGAVARLFGSGPLPRATPIIVIVMVVSAVISFVVARYEEDYGHRYHSEILLADAAHTRSDVYASIAVLTGIALVAAGYARADALVTILIAGVIARAGWRIVRRTVPILVDERAVEESAICDVARATPGVIDCFAVRSRGRKSEVFVELTITVDPRLNVQQGHVIADEVERRVAQAVGALEVVVHVEPAELPHTRADL